MASQITRVTFIVLIFLYACTYATSAQGPPPVFSTEKFVIQAMAHLHAAQATYQATTGAGSFGSLSQLRAAGFIDAVLATGSKYGYAFVVTPTQAAYTATATPIRYPKSGLWSYYIDPEGVLFGRDKGGQLADRTDLYVDTCAMFGMADNERCTIRSMRTLHGAEMTYAATTGNGNYGLLPQLFTAGLIDSVLGTGSKHGYLFTISFRGAPQPFLHIHARPQTYGTTGLRSFFIDESGVIRGADHGGLPSGPDDPPIEK